MHPPPAVGRPAARSSLPLGFVAAAAVGVLGGMIGLGGAEFRLPLLIALFGFAALQAVILNKALSLGTVVAGVIAGFLIGVVAAVMGVAGGELLIPTIVLLFGADIKVAGSLSLAVSLPTMLVAFARYSRDGSFTVLRRHARLATVLALGSIAGTILGGLLLGMVSAALLVPGLALLLLLSAIKVGRHATTDQADGS